MNRKGQLEDINPAAIGMGLICAVVALIVQKNVAVGMFWKIMTFVLSFITGYLIASFIANK